MSARIEVTEAARQAIRRLRAAGGPLMFVLSAGCCDGSAPMCFRFGEFRVGSGDVLIGDVEECPFYADRAHLTAWAHGTLVLDVAPGMADGFSLAAGDGEHFVVTTPRR